MTIPTAPADEPAAVPPARMPDIAISIIRTWVPIAVGALVAWLAASEHFAIPAHASAAAGAAATALVAGWYYTLARLLESARSETVRSIGRYMLGGVVPPIYVDTARATNVLK